MYTYLRKRAESWVKFGKVLSHWQTSQKSFSGRPVFILCCKGVVDSICMLWPEAKHLIFSI